MPWLLNWANMSKHRIKIQKHGPAWAISTLTDSPNVRGWLSSLLLLPPSPFLWYERPPVGVGTRRVCLSESPNGRDGVGEWQPLTTNGSTQTYSLIRHTCNERVPCYAPLRRHTTRINTHTCCSHTQTTATVRGEMHKAWHSYDSNALRRLHTHAAWNMSVAACWESLFVFWLPAYTNRSTAELLKAATHGYDHTY